MTTKQHTSADDSYDYLENLEHDFGFSQREMDGIRLAMQQREREIRLDERRKFRDLWNDLRMEIGASAGSATGVIVRNYFNEEWYFQLDRDAVNALFKHLSDKSPSNQSTKKGKV